MASLPRIGETISGFTVTELGTIHMLGARTVLFNHESSGAQLLYIQNDDRELGFNLIYRTPQLDERDNSHILEHDLGLPDMEGVDVIKNIRTWSNMPIIVISARSEDADKIEALDAGADDYITKPFSVEELLARIRVTQRRLAMIQSDENQESSVFINGQLKIDYTAGCTYLNGVELHLTPIEYKLLCLLSRNVGKVLTHTYITQQIWGSSLENDIASLRVFMATLRKKLEVSQNDIQYIQTHIGIGYRMLKIE